MPSLDMEFFDMPSLAMPSFDMPSFDMPSFDMPSFDMPLLAMPSLDMLSAACAATAPKARHSENAAVVSVFMMRSSGVSWWKEKST
ncbi:Uncharacterised protein [Achromobacter xylosoxidans]|nr:Uncharacterised protein [Achromobacter xylosoxidans]